MWPNRAVPPMINTLNSVPVLNVMACKGYYQRQSSITVTLSEDNVTVYARIICMNLDLIQLGIVRSDRGRWIWTQSRTEYQIRLSCRSGVGTNLPILWMKNIITKTKAKASPFGDSESPKIFDICF